MREVITYVAYDDTEFDNREECEKYEGRTFDLLDEIFNSYRFFMENKQEIYIFLNNVEDGLYALDYAWNKSAYICVKREVSQEVKDFICNYLGYDMPDNKAGLYKYTDDYGWVKVDK